MIIAWLCGLTSLIMFDSNSTNVGNFLWTYMNIFDTALEIISLPSDYLHPLPCCQPSRVMNILLWMKIELEQSSRIQLYLLYYEVTAFASARDVT